jgi:NADPH:quinone reductase-like Zn-dependent oxidoreductase
VLIHAAAGGVGHAAIRVCQRLGAEVYATASVSKHEVVKALGVTHVYDSRSTSWYRHVMRDTHHQGVHVVLNSLAGAHQQLGLQVLQTFYYILYVRIYVLHIYTYTITHLKR